MPAKVFVAYRAMLPTSWRDAAGFPRHNQQGNLVVIALVKRDVPALLTDRKLSQWQADTLAAELRLRRPPYDNNLQLLVDAGVIDPEKPGVYAWHNGVKNDAVVRIEPDGTPVVVAHFRYDSVRGGRGLYVEHATESEAS